jgi:hypothetical protein
MTTHPVPLAPRRRPRRRLAVTLIVAAATLLATGAPPAGAADPATPEEWIALVYRTCLHREPDPAGLEHWSARYGVPDDQGGAQIIARSVCFGEESLAPSITDTFAWILDREASADDIAYWAPRIRNRGSLHLVERPVLASPERYAASGGTDATYVTDLYERILDRPAGPGDIAYWVGRLGSGEHRVRTVDALLATLEARQARVTRIADATVDRSPSEDELDNCLYVLREFRDARLATAVFLERVVLLVP